MDNGNTKRYRLNQGKVAGKVIDGEAIVINAANGRYYSLDDASCVAWVHLSGGATLAEAAAAIAARYAVEPEVAGSQIAELADRLEAEDLIVEASANGVPAELDETGLPEVGGERRAFTELELVTFTDMEDLLAFDPPLPAAAPHDWEWRAE